jgi:glycerophosphoryl diester phosphodiesterase
MEIFNRPGLLYISHRGFRPLAPDNSLPGFEYAAILKQWAIETDVHMSADGVLVCNHDLSVDANYNGTGMIRDMTWPELSSLRLKTGSRTECFTDTQLRMPLFAEYLAICKKYNCVPFIEMKTDRAEAIVQAVREAGFEDDQVVMSTANLDWLANVRNYSKDMFLHWIFAREDGLERLSALGNAGLSWNYPNCRECPKEKIQLAHDMGLKVCLRAGDNVEDVTYMQELGLDYIPTNCMHEAL